MIIIIKYITCRNKSSGGKYYYTLWHSHYIRRSKSHVRRGGLIASRHRRVFRGGLQDFIIINYFLIACYFFYIFFLFFVRGDTETEVTT